MRLTDRNLARFAHETADLFGRFCAAVDHGALGRFNDAAKGIPATRFDRAGGSGNTVADPTGNDAVAAVEFGTEAAVAHRHELERMVIRARAAVERAMQLVDAYAAHEPDESARRVVARLNTRGEPGCASCARVDGPRGGPRWEPVHHAGATDVNGRLPEAMWLCRWCRDCVRDWGRLPSPRELTMHHNGMRVPWPPDVPHPREAG